MNQKTCVVINYGLGNTFSVINALRTIGANPILSDDYKIIRNADRVILPGVGAFGNGMRELEKRKLISSLSEYLSKERPLLGICLGMQLLMDSSSEFGNFKGLGFISGEVKKININYTNSDSIKVPLIGWYKTIFENPNCYPIAKKIGKAIHLKSFYYVHSYSVVPANQENLLAYVEHSKNKLVAAVCKDNILGVQFHPERSGKYGLEVIRKFMNL